MKKTMRKKAISIIAVISIFIGMISGLGLERVLSDNALKVKAMSDVCASSVLTEYSTVENCMFPMKGNITIWQTAYESGVDTNGERASHAGSCAMDISSESGYLCTPFTGKITGYAPYKCNEIVFTSDNKVRVPTGELCRVSVYALHSSNTDIEEKMNISYPQGTELIKQGQAISKGVPYSGYGIHFDVQVVKRATSDFADNAAYNGDELHYNCFFIDDEMTLNSTGARAYVSESDDPYQGHWVETNAFSKIKSSTSTLKVSIPYSLILEDTRDYNIIDRALGKPIDDIDEKTIKLSYIAKNYASINYDDLSEWEKKVYDSAEYEFCDYIPHQEEPERITIKFNAGDRALCSESERKIIKNTCSLKEFPTPTKKGFIFKGWFDKSWKEEYTYGSEINEDIELYAKWESELLHTTGILTTNITTTLTTTFPIITTTVTSNDDLSFVITEPEKNYVPETTTIYQPTVHYVQEFSPWGEWQETPIQPNDNIIIDQKTVTERKISSYIMKTYTTRTYDYTRISDNESIGDSYEAKSRDRVYGEFAYCYQYSIDEVNNAPIIKYGESQGGEMNSINLSHDHAEGYALRYGPYVYIFYKSEPVYETITKTLYRSRNIIERPVYS